MPLFDIFGGKSGGKAVKVVGNIVKGASAGIDKLIFTREERADVDRQIADGVTKFVGQTLSESTVRSRTRRWLAWAFSAEFIALLAAAAIAGYKDREYALFLLSLAQELASIVLAIVIFYFGYYGINAVMAGARKRKSDGK